MGAVVDFIKDKLNMGKPEQQDDQSQAPDNGFMPFKTQEEAVKFVNDEFERRRKMKRDFELQWMLNINFLNGNQYCDIDLVRGTLYQQDKAFDYQEMEVFNQIAPIYETRLAKLKQIKPTPYVRPASSETRDIATAKTSKKILVGLDSNLDMQVKRSMMTAWSELAGCCFLKHRWNPNAGRYIGEDENGNPIYEGDIEKDIVSPFEIYPDSNFAHGIEGCRSIIHARPMTVDEIWEQWDIKVPGRKIDVFTLVRSQIGCGLGYNTSGYKFTHTTLENSEIVKEYMHLPCKKYPQGLHIIVVADKLCELKPFIYRVGKNGSYGFPFEMQICIERPGFFWPVSIVERLIPVQRKYNAVKNRKHEILNRVAIGNLAIEDDGTVDVEDLEAEGLYPGKIHLYPRGGKPPEFIESNASTTAFDIEETKLENLFTMISGVSPFASQSLPPTGVVSGDAMEQLKEADDSRISLTADNIKNAAIQGWKIDLRLYKQFVPPNAPRLLRYVGENNEVDLIEWYSSDLTSDDVIVDSEDEIMQSPSQRVQIIKELLQYKLFSNDVDPKVRAKVIQMMRLGNWEDTADIEDLHIMKAKWENRQLMQGLEPDFADYDLHELHMQEHDRVRLDISFIEFKRSNPEIAARFDAHVKMHEEAIAQKAAAAAQQAQEKPAQSIPFKDLPIAGKIQQAAQAGIELTPEDLIQQVQLDAALKRSVKENQNTKVG